MDISLYHEKVQYNLWVVGEGGELRSQTEEDNRHHIERADGLMFSMHVQSSKPASVLS